MVGSAYLYSKDFSAIQTALQTLMATVHPEKVVPARTAFFIYGRTPKGYLQMMRRSSSRNFPSMTPKDASTIKARKTSTESAASPQTVKIATSEERNASMEAGIRHVTPEASRPFLSWIRWVTEHFLYSIDFCVAVG